MPVDLELFDELLGALLAGRKVNPEPFLNSALKIRQNLWQARRHAAGLEILLAESEPPKMDPEASFLRKVKFQLERLDHKVSALHKRVQELVDVDLLLDGRPFFVAEGSAQGVVKRVEEYAEALTPEDVDRLAQDQLRRLDEEIAKGVTSGEGVELSSDLSYRSDLLKELKSLYEIGHAARTGETWSDGPAAAKRPGREMLLEEVPWRAAWLQARVIPFWIGYDIDGLETICRAAGIAPPDVLVPAWRPFAEACKEFPDLKEALHLELRGDRDIGAFVSPSDIPELLDFLVTNGARIIQVATQHGEGPMCTTLLKKIRECATYAEQHGLAYLEASGIRHPDLPPEDEEEEV
jgi:hypothetical protein